MKRTFTPRVVKLYLILSRTNDPIERQQVLDCLDDEYLISIQFKTQFREHLTQVYTKEEWQQIKTEAVTGIADAAFVPENTNQ